MSGYCNVCGETICGCADAQSRAGEAEANLTDVLAAAQFERDCYRAALEEIWTTYINAGIYPISAGTLAYIAKDVLAANV